MKGRCETFADVSVNDDCYMTPTFKRWVAHSKWLQTCFVKSTPCIYEQRNTDSCGRDGFVGLKNRFIRVLRLLIGVAIQSANYQQAISMDFEAAMISAIHGKFSQTRVRGRLFHYSQAIW